MLVVLHWGRSLAWGIKRDKTAVQLVLSNELMNVKTTKKCHFKMLCVRTCDRKRQRHSFDSGAALPKGFCVSFA